MFRSRLARRLVVPLLLLIAALFGLLAITGVDQADRRVDEELADEADRIAGTIDALSLPPEQSRAVLGAMARLLDVELVLGAIATSEVDPVRYRRLERPVRRGTESLAIFVPHERIKKRRSDFLVPVLTAAALGLAIVALFGFAVVRMIVRPVQDLAERVAAFGRGEVVPPAGAAAPGELGDLQQSFDRMATSVRENERLAAVGRLAGGIAHELRNPLTAIRMAVETGGDEAKRIALSEIERLDRTLRELLDFVRPREPSIVTIALAPLFEDIRQLLEPQCSHLEVRLEIECESGATVRADRDRLQQALLNLVLNGAQAQPSGGVVRLRGQPGVVEVEDEGEGVPEEVRESLFEAFVSTKAAGIGLGLAVVKRIVDEHGARIELESGSTGTRIRLTFR
ncbi:MAG: ATP-binding protein [Planctomycetota bacterium]|jgi:signal transduction histidine kinase